MIDRRDPKIGEPLEALDRRAKRTFPGKSADVEFVDDALFPAAPAPSGVPPGVGTWVDHLTRAVDVVRLKAGGRVRHFGAVLENVFVTRTGLHAGSDILMPTVIKLAHGAAVAVDNDRNLRLARRPEAKTYAIIEQFRAERQRAVSSVHHVHSRSPFTGPERSSANAVPR
jgi:hypothetical protein